MTTKRKRDYREDKNNMISMKRTCYFNYNYPLVDIILRNKKKGRLFNKG